MSIVRDILNRKGVDVFTVSPETTVLDAAQTMNERRCGAVCVVEGGDLVGMFTERDVLNRVVAQQCDPASTKVKEVMTNPVVTCGPEAKARDCAAVMSARKIRHLPVVDGSGPSAKLIGMISTGDLMALEVSEKQAHIEELHNYLHGRT
jgi:CBS domain-containing protein